MPSTLTKILSALLPFAAAVAFSQALDAAAEGTAETAAAEESTTGNSATTAGTRRSQIDTRIFRLNHCSAAEVAAKFNEMWNGEFGQVWKVTKMAVSFPESNSIMLTAPTPILDACERAIGELDVEARQVYIEARFVELSNNASHKLGIDWQMLDGMGGTIKLGGGIQHSRLGSAVTDYSRVQSDGTTRAVKVVK